MRNAKLGNHLKRQDRKAQFGVGKTVELSSTSPNINAYSDTYGKGDLLHFSFRHVRNVTVGNSNGHKRSGIFLPGGRWTICPKNSFKLPKFLRNSRKEIRVMQCINNGLHMKWKYSCMWIYHMSSKNTLKLKTRSKNKRDILKCEFFGKNQTLFWIFFSKGGKKRIKAGKISKEKVKCCQKVTSCGNIYLKEHDFFLI